MNLEDAILVAVGADARSIQDPTLLDDISFLAGRDVTRDEVVSAVVPELTGGLGTDSEDTPGLRARGFVGLFAITEGPFAGSVGYGLGTKAGGVRALKAALQAMRDAQLSIQNKATK